MTKAQIIQEICRTATANGGIPLGSRRFETETGIKTSEWLGKLWARWNDALRDAGFAPNQMTGAYEQAELLDKYAMLALELGRLPTANDLRLKDKLDSDFPNAKTFEGLGTKKELVQKIIDHCKGRDGYENVVSMCEGYVPRNFPATQNAKTTELEMGFVYLIKSGKFYKIGRSNSVNRREYELAIQLPERAKTIHAIRTDDPSGIEFYWHRRFETKRKNGEWFDLDATDIAAFRRRKFM